MIKFLLVYGLEFLIGLTLVTQVIIPVFVKDLPLFWLFRPSQPIATVPTLDALDEEVNENLRKRNETKEKVEDIVKKVDGIKSKI